MRDNSNLHVAAGQALVPCYPKPFLEVLVQIESWLEIDEDRMFVMYFNDMLLGGMSPRAVLVVWKLKLRRNTVILRCESVAVSYPMRGCNDCLSHVAAVAMENQVSCWQVQ